MAAPARLSAMLCPLCHVGLNSTQRQGVEIDCCPGCCGVWLDRGELDKLIERSIQPGREVPGARQPTYRPDRSHGGAGTARVPGRRKTFLEELFD